MITLKNGLIAVCAVALIGCGANETKTPDAPKINGSPAAPQAPTYELKSQELSGYNYDISKYSGLEVGEPMDVAIEKIKTYLKPEGEGNMSVTWETQDVGRGIKTFSGLATNMADDSVKDQEIKIVSQKSDGEYWVIEHGGRVKCRRGDNQNKWTMKLCP